MEELKARSVPATVSIPTVRCTIFKDNCEEVVAIANLPKVRPRTKHINVRVHGRLLIKSINTKDQLADLQAKPLAHDLFMKLRAIIMGW